jgi:hypothetical protein
MRFIKRIIDYFNYLTSGEPDKPLPHPGSALPAPLSRPATQARPQTVSTTVPRPAPAPRVPVDSQTTIIGTEVATGREIGITEAAKRQSCYLIGTNSTGKTNEVKAMAIADAQAGRGFCVVEPHGQLIEEILGAIPRHRLNDIVYLDVEDWTAPFGLNIYEVPEPRNIRTEAAVASFVSHTFEVLWSAGFETPRLMQNLRAVSRVLIANPGAHFGDIPLLYASEEVRARMLANVSNPQILTFFEEYERMNFRDRRLFTESTLNKVIAFLDEPMIQHILCQSKTTINLRYIMENSKLLIIKLSPQFEEASRLIGAVIIGKILMTAFSRADTPEDKRVQFNLYCNEFHRFASSDFATLISEARKFRISTILSHQTLTQLSEQVRASALASGNIIVFRVSGDDSRVLSKSFDTTPARIINGEEVVRAPVADILTHLLRRGHEDPRVAKFGQTYLANLERFLNKPAVPHEPRYSAYYNCFDGQISLSEQHVVRGREWLNEILYKAMIEKRSDLHIPTLALYILAVAQGDGREYILTNWVTKSFGEFEAFKPGAEKFGKPSFTTPETSQAYISQITKGWKKKHVWMAEEMVSMLKEVRNCMEVLSREPIMGDTGRVQPRYQMQTHADREAEISKELTNAPNYTARVKLVNAGEYVLRTKPAQEGLTGDALAERIEAVKRHCQALGYTRHYTEVIEELRKRQELLFGMGDTRDEEADDDGDDPDEPPRGSFTLD